MRKYCSICIILLIAFSPRPCGAEESDLIRRWDLAYRSAEADSPDYALALGELQRGILFGIGDCDLYYRTGYCYEKLGKPDQARVAFQMALRSRDGRSPDILYYIHLHSGMLDFERSNLEEALYHFRRAAEIKPERWVARNNLTVLKRELGKKASSEYDLAIMEDLNPITIHNRAIILGEEGRMEEALAACEGAHIQGTAEPRISYDRAELLNASGRHDEAEKMYLACARDGSDDPGPYLKIAEIALLEDSYERFITNLQKALDIDPHLGFSPAISTRMGVSISIMTGAQGESALRDPGELGGEKNFWRDALSRNNADARAHYELARLYEYNGSGEKYGDGFPIGHAVKHYTDALSIDPNYAQAHLGIGSIYHIIGDKDVALNEYDAALKADRSLSIAHFNSGLIFLSQGRYDQAVQSFREALSYKPDLAQAHYQAALAFTMAGRYKEAIDEYKETLNLLPHDPDCYFNMGQIYASHLGEKEKAMECYRLYLRARPEAPDRRKVLGLIQLLNGRNI